MMNEMERKETMEMTDEELEEMLAEMEENHFDEQLLYNGYFVDDSRWY